MYSKALPSTLIMLLLIAGLQACRKSSNEISSNPLQTAGSKIERFLTLPENATSDLKKIVADLRKAETHSSFLENFISKNGMPLWQYTISPRKLFTVSSVRDSISDLSVEDRSQPPIYFIPLADDNTTIKSFLLCMKTGDSTYRYQAYNKEDILKVKHTTIKDFTNGVSTLMVFAAFENKINGNTNVSFPAPFNGISFKDAKINFSGITHSQAVDGKFTSTSLPKRSFDGGCIVNRFRVLIEFTILDYTVAIGIQTQENICTGEVVVVGFYIPGNADSGGSNNNGDSNGGGYGGSWGNSGNPDGYEDPGTGGGTGSGPYNPGMGTPYIPNDPTQPIYGYLTPIINGDIPIIDEWDDANTPILEGYYDDSPPTTPIPDDPQQITFNIDTDPFPYIANVIAPDDFVKYNDNPSACLRLCKQQIAKLGLQDLGSDNIFKIWSEQDYSSGGVINITQTKAAINYIVSKLRVGHAIIVGVDNKSGSINADQTSDHFVTIVGCGVQDGKPYFQFYDPATTAQSSGTHNNNRLYYQNGKLTGTSANGYAAKRPRIYTVAMVRRNSK